MWAVGVFFGSGRARRSWTVALAFNDGMGEGGADACSGARWRFVGGSTAWVCVCERSWCRRASRFFVGARWPAAAREAVPRPANARALPRLQKTAPPFP